MRIVKGLAVVVILMFAAASANAAGFRLPEAGAKAMGMGFAFTAQANDPSAIYFNPAGLTQLEGQNVMAGVTYVRENGGEFTGTTPLSAGATISETQKDLNFFIPNVYWTRKASPTFAYGVGVFAPFGLGQEYNDRDASFFRNQVTKVDIQTVVINPTVAWQIDPVLSVGVGIDFMWGRAKLAQTAVINNSLPPTDLLANQLNAFKVNLEGDGTAWGYNLGLLLKPTPNLNIGFSYRSRFSLDLKDADVDVSDISTTPFVPGSPLAPLGNPRGGFGGAASYHSGASATIEMPATAALGAAYTSGRVTLEADLDWTFWSAFKELAIHIKNPTPLLTDSKRPENWKDVMALRLGAEYRVTDPLALRLGFSYDPTPVPAETMSPLLPDATRLYYLAGAGYKVGNWTFDASYGYIQKKDRTVNNQGANLPPAAGFAYPQYARGFNGEWTGDAHLLAFDVAYKF